MKSILVGFALLISIASLATEKISFAPGTLQVKKVETNKYFGLVKYNSIHLVNMENNEKIVSVRVNRDKERVEELANFLNVFLEITKSKSKRVLIDQPTYEETFRYPKDDWPEALGFSYTSNYFLMGTLLGEECDNDTSDYYCDYGSLNYTKIIVDKSDISTSLFSQGIVIKVKNHKIRMFVDADEKSRIHDLLKEKIDSIDGEESFIVLKMPDLKYPEDILNMISSRVKKVKF